MPLITITTNPNIVHGRIRLRDLRNRNVRERQARQAEVEHHRQADKQAQRPDVNGFDDGIAVERLVEGHAPGRVRHPSEEAEQYFPIPFPGRPPQRLIRANLTKRLLGERRPRYSHKGGCDAKNAQISGAHDRLLTCAGCGRSSFCAWRSPTPARRWRSMCAPGRARARGPHAIPQHQRPRMWDTCPALCG